MRFLIIILFYLFANQLFSQTIDEKIAFTLNAKNENRLSDFVKYEDDILTYLSSNYGEDTNYVNTILQFSEAHFNIENYKKSLDNQKKANQILLRYYPENSKKYQLNLLIEKFKHTKLYVTEKNNLEIVKYENDIVTGWKKLFGEDSILISILDQYSEAYFNLHDYQNSERIQIYMLNCIEHLYSKKSELYRSKLFELSSLYVHQSKYSEQLIINKECLKITEALYNKSDLKYLDILNFLAVNQTKLGDYNKAIDNFNIYIDTYKKFNITLDSNYIQTLNNLGIAYNNINNYQLAIKTLENAIKINKDLYKNDNILSIITLANLGTVYSSIGQYSKSIKYNLLALDIFDKIDLNEYHKIRIPTILNNIALSYKYLGDINQSIYFNELCIQNIDLRDEKFNDIYFINLENLGSNYLETGNYQKSLNVFFECLDFYKKNQPNSINYMILNTRIGLNYYHLNDYKKALEYFEIVKNWCEINNHINSDIYYQNQNNIALIYTNTNKSQQAIKLLYEVLKFDKKYYRGNKLRIFITLNNIAQCYSQNKEYKKSIKIYKKNLANYKLNNIHCINSLNNIGFDYLNLNNHDKSILYFNQSRKIISTIFKDTVYESLRNTLNGLIDNYKEIKQFSIADSLINESINLSILQLNKNKFGLTESEFLSFSNEIYFDLLFKTDYSISRSTKNPTILSKTLDYYINYKLLNENGGLKDSNQIDMHSEFNKQKVKLNSYLENKDTIRVDEDLKFNSNKIERELTKSFKNNIDFEKKDWKSIQNSLKENESIIIINRIPLFVTEEKVIDSNRYLVYIINKSTEYPEIVLCNEGDMFDKMINDFQSNNYSFDNMFSTKFWLPIEDKLNGNKNIYIMLDGEFNKVNLNTIYNTKTKQYIIDEYRISYVMKLSDFINKNRLDQNQNQFTTSVLIGSPNFNNSLKENKIKQDSIYSYIPLSLRNFNMDIIDSNERGSMIKSLPNTKIEIQNIEKILISNKIKNTSFIEEEASESNLKSINSPSILHIATHGYFVEDEKLKYSDFLLGFNKSKLVENPLLRSGLMLKGAGNFLNGNPNSPNENGLFTALEASTVDLTKTELVVLSACETGRGKIINGQGVQGLQKGFKDAGTKKIIMSLWKVDDKVTQEFMTTFYTLLFSEKDIHTAFTKTQLQIKEKYKLPYYWGAFILSEY